MNHTHTIRRVFAVILALVMACGLCACGQDDTPDVPSTNYEQVAEEYVKAYFLRDFATRFSLTFYEARRHWEDGAIEDNGSAEAFFAEAQKQAAEKGIEVTVDSFDSYYAAYHQFILKDCQDIYGEYTITVKATESRKLEGDLLSELVETQLGAIDENYIDEDALRAVTDAYMVSVQLEIDGEKKEHSAGYSVYVVYHNKSWLVLTHST